MLLAEMIDPGGLAGLIELAFYGGLVIGSVLLLTTIAMLLSGRPGGGSIVLGTLDLLFAGFCLYCASLLDWIVPLIVGGASMLLGLWLMERATRPAGKQAADFETLALPLPLLLHLDATHRRLAGDDIDA